jgi:hypothetical protein
MSTPIISPDLSEGAVDNAVTIITEQAEPFLSKKVRATIYTVAGLIAVVGVSIAPVIGGTVGTIIDGISAAAAAITSVLAVSHISK